MDPPGPGQLGGSLVSPGGSRVLLPLAMNGEGVFTAMTSPMTAGSFVSGIGSSNSSQGGSGADSANRGGERREVFSDLRRFVSFGLRKDSTGSS